MEVEALTAAGQRIGVAAELTLPRAYRSAITIAIVTSPVEINNTLWPQRAMNPSMVVSCQTSGKAHADCRPGTRRYGRGILDFQGPRGADAGLKQRIQAARIPVHQSLAAHSASWSAISFAAGAAAWIT